MINEIQFIISFKCCLQYLNSNIYIYIFLNYLKKCYFLLIYYIKPVNDPFRYVKGFNLNDRSHNAIDTN